jgi:hypothetical protein
MYGTPPLAEKKKLLLLPPAAIGIRFQCWVFILE